MVRNWRSKNLRNLDAFFEVELGRMEGSWRGWSLPETAPSRYCVPGGDFEGALGVFFVRVRLHVEEGDSSRNILPYRYRVRASVVAPERCCATSKVR